MLLLLNNKQGGGAVDPRAAVLALNPDLLFDKTDNSTMYQDELKTTPVAATNDPVAVVEDLGSAGEDVVIPAGQTTYRPLRSTNGVTYDGVNDGLLKAFSSLSLTYPFTIIIALKSLATTSNRYMWSGDQAGGYAPAFIVYNSSGDVDFCVNPPYGTAAAAPDPDYDHDTNDHIWTKRFSSSASERSIRKDGVELTVAAMSSYTVGGIAFGRPYGLATGLNSNVEIQKVFVKNAYMNDTDVGIVETWMNDQGVL